MILYFRGIATKGVDTMEDSQRSPMIGEVYLMNFNGESSEQKGWRPGVVFQNNLGNNRSPNVIALPLTTALKKIKQPTHVVIKAKRNGLLHDSMVLCENPEKMSKTKMGKFITKLSDNDMKQIAKANLIATSAISFLDMETLLETWKESVALNAA